MRNKIFLFLVIVVVVYIIFVSTLYYFSEKEEEKGMGSFIINPFKVFLDFGSLSDFTSEINLIDNPDFENDVDGDNFPDDWFLRDEGEKSKWVLDCTESYSGSCSAKLNVFENLNEGEVGDVLRTRRYSLEPNKIYYLYFWTKKKTGDENKGPQFTLVLEDERNEVLDTKSINRRFNNENWIKHQIRFETGDNIKKFRVYSRAVGTKSLESWLDNLKLKVIDEEAEIPRVNAVYTAESLFNEEKVDELMDKEINTFLVKGGYENNIDYSGYIDKVPDSVKNNARLAKQKNINYFQAINFVHRVDDSIITDNYVVYSDGRAGKHVTPFDEVYWNHLSDLIVNLARLPVSYPNDYQINGVYFDFELYKNEDNGEPRKFDKTWGFEDTTFKDYLVNRGIEYWSSPPKNPSQRAERYSWLETNELLEDYYSYLENIIRGFAEEMKNRVREVNSDFLISSYPSPLPVTKYLPSIFNGWSSEDSPAVIWGTETYYGGELPKLLEQNRLPQGYYYLYDLYGEEIYAYYISGLVVMGEYYSVNNFAYNLYKIGTKTNGYWMFPSYSFTESFNELGEDYHLRCYDSIRNILYKCEEYEYPKIVEDYYNELVVANSEINKFVESNTYETFLREEPEPLRECSNGQSLQCGSDIGECDFGIRNCINEEWDICGGDVEPVNEIIDGLDNDCDGEVDEVSGGSIPVITYVGDIPDVNPIEGLTVPVDFEFIVQDNDGVSDLDDSSAKAKFVKQSGGIKTGNCIRIQKVDEYSVKYSCTINMRYYDEPGEWKIYVEVFDFSENKASDESKNFYYNELTGFSIESNFLNWETVGFRGKNVILNEPVIVHNTGNADIDLLKIKSYDLKGVEDKSYSFDVGSFSVNIVEECEGIVLVNDNVVDIIGSNIPVIEEFGVGIEKIYFCLEEVPLGLKSQEYVSEEGKKWVVGI